MPEEKENPPQEGLKPHGAKEPELTLESNAAIRGYLAGMLKNSSLILGLLILIIGILQGILIDGRIQLKVDEEKISLEREIYSLLLKAKNAERIAALSAEKAENSSKRFTELQSQTKLIEKDISDSKKEIGKNLAALKTAESFKSSDKLISTIENVLKGDYFQTTIRDLTSSQSNPELIKTIKSQLPQFYKIISTDIDPKNKNGNPISCDLEKGFDLI